MSLNVKLDRSTLRSQAAEILFNMIKERKFPGNRLPAEEELARRMGVSRATVREALYSLVQLGVITKRQGKGNFCHPTIANLSARLDISTDFLELLRAEGKEARVVHRNLAFTAGTAEARKYLALGEGEEVVRFDRLYYQDGRPAILAEIEIPRNRFKELPSGGEAHPTLKEFYEHYCEGELVKMIIRMKSRIYPPAAELFGLDSQTPLLWWQEKWLTLEDQPACYSSVHFNPNIDPLAMVVALG
ncbi:MAG: GntR family transcriptional regulator [Thermoanaerobacteraceae bacterium]|nr:GntR family transcriptional regulator [Thermoanaerobacteraceae bacterium]